MIDPEKRFRKELKERIYKEVGDFFIGRAYCIPVMKSDGVNRNNIIRKVVEIPKKKLADFIYKETLKKVPWLKESKK